MSELVIAAFTALFGVFVFVLGQLIQKTILEPIQEQRTCIGEIAFNLVLLSNMGGEITSLEKREEAITTVRSLGAKLRASLSKVPAYDTFASVGFVLPRESVLEASKELIGWSNTFHSGESGNHRDKIGEALGITWKT